MSASLFKDSGGLGPYGVLFNGVSSQQRTDHQPVRDLPAIGVKQNFPSTGSCPYLSTELTRWLALSGKLGSAITSEWPTTRELSWHGGNQQLLAEVVGANVVPSPA
jgi:hypothetical protein